MTRKNFTIKTSVGLNNELMSLAITIYTDITGYADITGFYSHGILGSFDRDNCPHSSKDFHMHSILPRASRSQPIAESHPHNGELFSGKSQYLDKLHWDGSDSQPANISLAAMQTLEKIKICVPPQEQVTLSLAMNGHCAKVDLINLHTQKHNCRFYFDQDGNLFAAGARPPGQTKNPDANLLNETQKSFATTRPLIPIPHSAEKQTVIVTQALRTKDTYRGSLIQGATQCTSGGAQSLTASASLAVSASQLTLAAGNTGLGLGYCLYGLGQMANGGGQQEFITSLGSLAVGASQVQQSATHTALNTLNLGFGLGKMVYGMGQYAYSASHVFKKSAEAKTIAVGLVERPRVEPKVNLNLKPNVTIQPVILNDDFNEPD